MLTGKRVCESCVGEDGTVTKEVLKKPKGEGYVISSSEGMQANEYDQRLPMDYELANGKKSMEIDEDLHSRQLAVYGRETMRRLFASSVLVSGLQGLGTEIAKNLVLAGVQSITLHDEGNVELWDLSSNFYLSEDDVGNNRAVSCVQKLQELNNTVMISVITGALSKEKLSDFQVSNKADIVNKVVYDLLQHGEEWNKFRRTSLKKKIEHCILLDNFVPNVGVSMDARTKALQSHSKRSQKHMSLQQHRKHGSFNMPKEFHKFELVKPMHEMWKAYILELLQESSKKQLAQCLLAADLHGAFIVVVECKTRSFVGISGIMIRETMETFGIIKRDNHFRVVPKRGSVFIFQAGCWKVTLHGDKLSLRNIA